jgi:hypothetical protein
MCMILSVYFPNLLHITKQSRKRLLVTKTQYEDISKCLKANYFTVIYILVIDMNP